MQAQNAAEGEKSKKDGQHATPPARSEAGRLGITKEFVDFLLEHGVKPVPVKGFPASCSASLPSARVPLVRILYRESLPVHGWCPIRAYR